MTAGRGGKRPGAGRPKGSRNKATQAHRATVRELAEAYAEEAISALVDVARNGSDGARVSAAVALLDRAFGKPAQSVEMSGKDGGPIQTEDVTRDAESFARRISSLAAAHAGAGDGEADEGSPGGA